MKEICGLMLTLMMLELTQDAGDMGAGIVNVVERLESEYLSSLEDSYAKLSDRTFKELRRKLPVTRTLFSWDKALQLSLSRDLAREFTSKR
jgi:capping protein alpha